MKIHAPRTGAVLEQLHARRAEAVAPDTEVHIATLDTILARCAQHPTVYLPSHDPRPGLVCPARSRDHSPCPNGCLLMPLRNHYSNPEIRQATEELHLYLR